MILLSEAYAFGVVWSFSLKSLGVLALRFQRHDQEYKTPLNFKLGGTEIPVGLALVTTFLFLVAIANLFTKKIATIYGVSFTAVLRRSSSPASWSTPAVAPRASRSRSSISTITAK